MNMTRKLDLAQQSIASITRHDDEDLAIRAAALDKLDSFVKAERAAMEARVQERAKSLLG